jgi:hypothetical protein
MLFVLFGGNPCPEGNADGLRKGVDSEYVDLAKIVSCKVHDGLNQSFYQDIAKLLADRIRLCGDRVPVVTGNSRLYMYITFRFRANRPCRILWGCPWRAA